MGFPKPLKKSMIYEDKKLYACLATQPLTKGHVVVAWKKPVRDLHLLSKRNYEYLMDKVDEVRDTMLKTLGIKKVYLLYLDEANHVHWHLIPRYSKKGFNMLVEKPKKLKSFKLVEEFKKNL